MRRTLRDVVEVYHVCSRAKTSSAAKPYLDFPLFLHATRRWAKKIKGKTHFFGQWGHKEGDRIVPVADLEESASAAKLELDRQWPYLAEGRTAPSADTSVDTCTLKSLCNAFWRSKRAKLLAGELSQRSFKDYELTTDLLVASFGKDRRVDDLRPDDFERLRSSLAERLGVHALKNTINRCRVVFKFAWDNPLIAAPVNYGQSFNRPTAKAMRRARNAAGARLFEAAELRTLLDALEGKPVSIDGEDEPVTLRPDPIMKAMVLLGVNLRVRKHRLLIVAALCRGPGARMDRLPASENGDPSSRPALARDRCSAESCD